MSKWTFKMRFQLLAMAGIAMPAAPGTASVIAPAPGQPEGALSGRIVFASAGHGWTFDNSRAVWFTQRGDNNEVVEDYGNLDQMNMFVAYCFNAGATVVPFRPVGYQTNEVVMDNTHPGVTFLGSWSNSSATGNFFGSSGQVPYRFASIGPTETATATYTPNISATGFYPVYSWVSHGDNRTSQLYRIRHTGGESTVRLPHFMVGNGWVYLGTYYFNAGSNPAGGSVIISNLEPAPRTGSVVIADAIRFGNGRGDVVPVRTDGGTATISGYPREEEAARYWVQRMLGVGQSASLYETSGSDSSDNVGTPPRMAREMNRESNGNLFKRIFISFHSNAGGGSARGVLALHNGNHPGASTPNQFRLAQLVGQQVNGQLSALTVPPLELAWHNRGNAVTLSRTDIAFGEINDNAIDGEFDATIVEVGFHDNADDARLLRDPKVRKVAARATYHAVVRYMNEFDGLPLNLLPEPPRNVRATSDGSGTVTVQWSAPDPGGSNPTGYLIYLSTDGWGFGNPVRLQSAAARSFAFTNVPPNVDFYYRVAAFNSGGESFPSETVGCSWSNRGHSPLLFVNAFDRFDRFLAVRQTAGPGIGGYSGGVQTFDRVQPRLMNSFDYVVHHGQALKKTGVSFDSCANEAILNNDLSLLAYSTVIWACGRESTADETFSAAEQSHVTAFLDAGGNFFVSGSEIAWDLDRDSGPSTADRAFIRDQLHALLGGNANDDAGTYAFGPADAGIFSGNPAGNFDDGSFGVYDVQYPDVLTPTGAGAIGALNYVGGRGGGAGIQAVDPGSGSRIVFLGFPFEAITSPALQEAYLFDIMEFFQTLPAPLITSITLHPGGSATVFWESVQGRSYRLEYKASVGGPWIAVAGTITAGGSTAFHFDASAGFSGMRFYRVVLVE